MIRWLGLGLVALLSGCTHLPNTQGDVKPGQSLILYKPIDIPPQQARRFIQHGQLLTRAELDERYAHCRIEVSSLREQTYVIEPDRFRITRVRNDVEAIAQAKAILLASLGDLPLLAMGDDGPAEMMELVMLYLDSPKQPDVLRLVCAGKLSDGNPSDYPDYLRPDLAKINQLLGDWAQVH